MRWNSLLWLSRSNGAPKPHQSSHACGQSYRSKNRDIDLKPSSLPSWLSGACTLFWGFAPHFGLLPHLLDAGGTSSQLWVPSSHEKHKPDTSQTLPDSDMVLLLQTSGLDTNLESLKVLTAPCVVRHLQPAKHKLGKPGRRNLQCGPSSSCRHTGPSPHHSVLHVLQRDTLLFQKASFDSWDIAQILLFQSRKEPWQLWWAWRTVQSFTKCHQYRRPCTNSCHHFTPEGCDTWPSCQNFTKLLITTPQKLHHWDYTISSDETNHD